MISTLALLMVFSERRCGKYSSERVNADVITSIVKLIVHSPGGKLA